eukprot:7382650-Prymnesium_polylepis.2
MQCSPAPALPHTNTQKGESWPGTQLTAAARPILKRSRHLWNHCCSRRHSPDDILPHIPVRPLQDPRPPVAREPPAVPR